MTEAAIAAYEEALIAAKQAELAAASVEDMQQQEWAQSVARAARRRAEALRPAGLPWRKYR